MKRLICLALLVACKGKTDAPAKASKTTEDPNAQVSRMETPAPPPQRSAPPMPDTMPGVRRDVSALVGRTTRAAIGELDGHTVLVLVDPDSMRVVDKAGKQIASMPVIAGIQQLSIANGKILAGWGASREHTEAVARFTLTHLDKDKLVEEVVLAPTTTRPDVTGAIADGDRLHLAYFDSKYGVTKVTATHGASGWTASDPLTFRMATGWAIGDVDGSGKKSLVASRIYGDQIGSDGDAFVLSPDGKRTVLPTTRGAQSIAVADTDGDGKAEIFVGDGWAQNYAKNAQGLLTWIRLVDGAPKAQLIEDTPGQYSITQIIAADVDGDGKPEIIARGNAYVRVYKRSGDAWKGITIAGKMRDVAVGDLDGKGIEVLVVGDHSEVVDLHTASW
jgi:hypothetical protein